MSNETNWAPDACTLPTTEQPLRIGEFGTLFASSLRGVDRETPNRLRLTLDASARDEAVRLTEAETSCCSFFTFTIGKPDGGRVELDIEVPEKRVEVLDSLTEQATTAGAPA